MPELDANIAHFLFEVEGLAEDTFRVVSFTGVEELSRPFRFELELTSDLDDIAFADVVNRPATLTLMRGLDEVPVSGTVAQLEQAGRTPDAVAYRAVLVPRLWRLSLYHQSRIFQQKSVEDILTQVLQEAGFSTADFRFDLSGSYPPREYCVQYNETDLDFLSRLLEHEGICYYFEHDGERDVVVMADDRGAHPPIEDDGLVYRGGSGMVGQDTEFVDEWIYRESATPEKVQLKDYNGRTPETTLLAEEPVESGDEGTHYEYGNHFADNSEGGRLAKVRSQEIECRRRVVQARSNCAALHAGYTFRLDEHYRLDFNDTYLVTRVTHEGSQREAMGTAGGTGGRNGAPEGYRNAFTCIPARVQYRPPRATPVPRLRGLMTAKVDSAGGDYAYIDEDGSYHALMPFDQSGAGGGNATLPIRMAQPYSGANYGMHFPLHQNTEIIWGCIDGNLDCPVALGTVPNPTNASPSVAGNKQQNVIRTWGQHELTFDDTTGSENIYLHSTKDWTIDIANDKNQTIGNKETTSIGSDRDKTVGGSQTEAVTGDKMITVGGNHTETITGNMSQTVSASKTETITVAKALSIGGAYQVSVGGAENHTVGGLLAQEVGGAKTVAVGLASSENVGMNKSVSAGKDISERAGKNFACQAGQDFSAQAGKKMTLSAGDDVAVSGGKKGVIDIADELTIKCGSASITLKKNGDILIKGKNLKLDGSGKIDVKASSDVKIDGSKVGIK